MSEIRIDKLLRSRRKTVSLQITPEALLVVRAPYQTSEEFIYEFIRKKADWIRTKQEFFERRGAPPSRNFLPGEEYQFLGRGYTLEAVDDLPRAVVLGQDSLRISRQVLGNAGEHLKIWYKAQAQDYLSGRVRHYASLAGLVYRSIRLSEATGVWGSCGYKGTLNFSWRLIMAAAPVIDYVVVHELMHLRERNHSRRFWTHVAAFMPEYQARERWLKENGHLLVW